MTVYCRISTDTFYRDASDLIISTSTSYLPSQVRLPGDQNVAQLDTSQDESKYPYTSSTLMSVQRWSCWNVSSCSSSMSPGKQRLHIKKSVDDTVLFRVVQVRLNSDGNTSNRNSQLRIQIKYFHRAIWMSISFGTKHKVWKRSEPDLAGTNKSSKMELYKRPRIIFTTLYTLLSTYKENTERQ